MECMKRSMKYSLVFGICGCFVIPVIYEIYANVSRDIALWLFAAYVLAAGVKFSGLPAKEAFLGITCTVAYSSVLAIPAFLLVHPRVKSMLEKRSKYFALPFREQVRFLIAAALIFLLMYLFWLTRAGFKKAFEKFRSNGEKAKGYIENAFDDSKDEEP